MKFERKYDNLLTKELLTELYLIQKLTIKEICEKTGVTNHTIYNYLDLYKLRENREGHIKPGFKNNKLTAIKIIGKRKCGTYIWECRCECGKITKVDTSQLKKGSVKSCKCLLKEERMGDKHHLWKGFGEISGNTFNGIKVCAKNRNISFNTTIEYIWQLFLDQNKKCALSGLDLEINSTASLDRINSDLDYSNDNIWWLHKDINKIKSDLSLENFKKLCIEVSNPTKIQNPNINQKLCPAFWYDIQYNAKKRNINFQISKQDIICLFIEQNGCCAITGQIINLPQKHIEYKSRIHTASLDRIKNNEDYTLDNIQWVHKKINQSRKDLELGYYKKLCQLVI